MYHKVGGVKMLVKPTERQKSLNEKVRGIAKEIASRNREVDETSEFPWDIFHIFRENQILDLPYS